MREKRKEESNERKCPWAIDTPMMEAERTA
jgi:hypothetical protein